MVRLMVALKNRSVAFNLPRRWGRGTHSYSSCVVEKAGANEPPFNLDRQVERLVFRNGCA